MQWYAKAPANIALIKYMGKRNTRNNTPSNASLSYTLNHLSTEVSLELIDAPQDTWQALASPNSQASLQLTPPAIRRFLQHLQFIKRQFNCQASFQVSSGNNFPHGAGLASSASSFAALTQCAAMACAQLTQTTCPDHLTQAAWSQQGSGSSCRSFFAPWALWQAEQVQAVSLPYPKLLHQVILLETAEKSVGSSLAHLRVSTSPQFPGRAKRAEQHLEALLRSLNLQRWDEAYLLCWQEFQDMHALFHTANPAFSYFNPNTQQVLAELQQVWRERGDGPLVTMDAGPNIHLLYRPDQQTLRNNLLQHYQERYDVL